MDVTNLESRREEINLHLVAWRINDTDLMQRQYNGSSTHIQIGADLIRQLLEMNPRPDLTSPIQPPPEPVQQTNIKKTAGKRGKKK